MPSRGQLQIVWFNVAMDNLTLGGMQVDEGIEQLVGPGNNLLPRKRSRLCGNDLSQVGATNKLHDEKCSVAFSEIIADARQRGMM